MGNRDSFGRHPVSWVRSLMNLPLPTLAEPPAFALWERFLFLVLAATSCALFARRFVPILRKIVSAKHDPDFRLFPLGRRIWDFIWEFL